MRNLVAVAMLVAVCTFVSPKSAKADAVDFVGGKGGSLSFVPYAGNSLSITGAPITCAYNASAGNCSPASGEYSIITGGLLSLTTGKDSTNFNGCVANYSFGPGGTISITGNSSTLLTGSVSSATGTCVDGNGTLTADFDPTYLSPSLLAALGISGKGVSGTDTESVISLHFGPGTSHSRPASGTIESSTVSATTVVPEPATLSLLGAGLLAMGGLFRLRRPRKKA